MLNSPRSLCLRTRCRSHRAGFTLLELATAIVIILILATMLVQFYGNIQAKAARAVCQGNLRSLYTAASSYVTDHQQWPQMANISVQDPGYPLQWIAAFKSYGVERVNWICPTVQTALEGVDYVKNPRIDYFGAYFDTAQNSPFRYPTHPWFIERGDMHGDGNLIIFANGQVKSLQEVVATPGVIAD